MEIFVAQEIALGIVTLGSEESRHCVRVLRHRAGDVINVIDGEGTMYECSIQDEDSQAVSAAIIKSYPLWNSHPYHLTLAVCPTKNVDRMEWAAEKATEIGVDCIVPIIGEHSERKVFKTDRLKRIVFSAAKQSLKASVPVIKEPVDVKSFIAEAPADALKLIAYCFENGELPRRSIKEILSTAPQHDIIVMIGPEGDFSAAEAQSAILSGFIPVHLGDSRLRTETAAITAAEAVYFKHM